MAHFLLFDLGGVLVKNDMFAELRDLMGTKASEAALKAKWLQSTAARKFELGLCTPEVFAALIVKEFALATSPRDFLKEFVGWPKGFYPGVTDFPDRLRANHALGCLSNSNAMHWTDEITGPFDVAFSSHLMNRIKPDAAVFGFVLDVIDELPENVVFFDDSAPNMKAARECGMKAYLTVGFEQLRCVVSSIEGVHV